MNSQREKMYQWAIGVIVGLLLMFGGAVFGTTLKVSPIEKELRAHEALPSHPVSAVRYQEIDRRLTRIENKQDAILTLLQDLTAP